MRILLVNDYATATAGAERITRDLRDGFRARGHEVRVFASRAQLIAGESFADAECFGTNTRLQTLTSMLNPAAARALERELRDHPPDVVQVQMFLWQLSPAILPLLRTLPAVYWAMTVKEICPTGLKWLPSGTPCTVRPGIACLTNGCVTATSFVPLMVQRRLWHRNQHAFRAILCCSVDVQHRLEGDGIATHGVVPPGVPESAPRPPLAGPPTITFAGRLTPEKGADVLLRAFALARQRVPGARLSIAGTGPAEPALRALATELGVSGAARLHGHLSGAALDAMLDSAWVHAVPSRWPEPFGLTATEAMMRGTAVVASEVGGLADIVLHERTGLRVPAGDVPALADALVRVLSDRDWAEELGRAARVRAREQFSLDGTLTRLEQVYEQLRFQTSHPAHAS